MSNLILIIPFIISLLLLLFFHKKVVWWEYLILIIPAILINVVASECMKYYNCNDTEYLGDYVKEVRYYESWNEWIHRTCTRTHTDSKGNTHTTTYDCSYCRTYPEEYKMITALKNSYTISKNDYSRIVNLWTTPNRWVDMHRHYYTKDGDMYSSIWDNKYETIISIAVSNSYKNKVKGSKSVFKFEEISKNEAEELGLFEYTPIIKQEFPFPQDIWTNTYQETVLGFKDKELMSKMNYINAKYGATRFIRTYMLIFKDKPHEIAFKQKSYWEGGNFNEHVICLGLNTKTNKFDWCETFSWEDKPDLAVRTKQWFITNDSITSLKVFPIWYESIIKNNTTWVCKEKDDFEYLKTELTTTQFIWLLCISLVICISIGIWVIINNITYNKDGSININY